MAWCFIVLFFTMTTSARLPTSARSRPGWAALRMGRVQHPARGRRRALRLRAPLGAHLAGRRGLPRALPDDPEDVRGAGCSNWWRPTRRYNSTLRLVDRAQRRRACGPAPRPAAPSDVIALTADSKNWGEGVKLAYVEHARHAACPFAGTKILSWAMNLTWLESAQRARLRRSDPAERARRSGRMHVGQHFRRQWRPGVDAAAQLRLPAGDHPRGGAGRNPRARHHGSSKRP